MISGASEKELEIANDRADLLLKINQLQSNWNSLREWLEYQAEHTMQQHNYYGVLDKMNELEGRDKK